MGAELTRKMTMTDPEHFEMRRLEMLSNTIFGVAMTLLAYDLPRTGQFGTMPGWSDLWHTYSDRLIALIISFVIAGVFWISHHRRLARQPYGSRAEVMINLLFLLMIILLPASNGLYGSYRLSNAVAMLYGLHLTAIAGLNALLWWLALRENRSGSEIVAAAFPVGVFVIGTVIAAFSPQFAQYCWFVAFAAFLVKRVVGSRAA